SSSSGYAVTLMRLRSRFVHRVGAVAAALEHAVGDGPPRVLVVDPRPLGDGDPLGDAPRAVAPLEAVDEPEPGDEGARALSAGGGVERHPVGLDARVRGVAELDEWVPEEVHREVVPPEEPLDPDEELLDGAGERAVRVGGVGVVAGADELEVEPVDPTRVP